VAGFIGFAPASHPRVLVYTAVIDPKDQPQGNRQAAPLVREVTELVLKKLGVPAEH
jgi:cell division protein FtsI/penicillin-binding protein 2